MEWESRLLGWKKLGGKANYIANEAQFIRKRVLPMCMNWRDIWAGDQEEGGCVWVYDLRATRTSAPRAVWPRIWGRGEERLLGRGLGWLVTASMCVEIPGEIVRIRKRDLVERSVLARASSVK